MLKKLQCFIARLTTHRNDNVSKDDTCLASANKLVNHSTKDSTITNEIYPKIDEHLSKMPLNAITVKNDILAIWQSYDLDVDKINEFNFNEQHLQLIRKMYFYLDTCEAQVPSLDLITPYGSADPFNDLASIFGHIKNKKLAAHHCETMDALQYFLLHAELEPGLYKPNNRPINNTSFAYSDTQNYWHTYLNNGFEFKFEHKKLIKNLCWQWPTHEIEDNLTCGFYPVIGVNPKRPYGSYTYYQADMAIALDLNVDINHECNIQLSTEQENYLSSLHREMLAAVQIFVEHASLIKQ